MSPAWPRWRDAWDPALVAVCVVLTALPYIADLGFYNDDWFFLATFANARGSDVWTLSEAAMIWSRPVQVLYSAALFWLFGTHPLGYHVTNTLVLAAGAGLLNGLLRTIGTGRAAAFATAIIWATLPHAATGRFWYATFNLFSSLALIFLAALCELRFVERRAWCWRGGALLSLVASGLLYEIGLPLTLLIPLLAVRHARSTRRDLTRGDRLWFGVYPAAICAMFALKAMTTHRMEASTPSGYIAWFLANLRGVFAAPDGDALWGLNIWRALDIAFVDLGIHLPRHAVASLGALSAGSLVIVGLVSLTVFLRLVSAQAELRHATARGGWWLGLCGLSVFLIGWSIFLSSASLQLTPAGVGNRVAGAASLGVALVFVGVLRLAAAATRSRKPVVFALLAATLVGSSTAVIHRVANDWGRAWQVERQVLAQIQSNFPTGFGGRTLLLDGVCQYIGPAIVFEASWDVRDALRARYRDPTIEAEVAEPGIEVRQADLRTTLYNEERLYKYGSVVAFRPPDTVRDLNTPDEAEQFLTAWDPAREGSCAPGRIGHGAGLFEDVDPIVFVGGFYPPERDGRGREWRWMNRIGVVSLRNTGADMVLTIRASVPAAIGRRTITVTFNGTEIDSLAGVRAIDRRYKIAPESQGGGQFSELRIRTDQVVVPHALDHETPDARPLGLLFERLTWERDSE